MTVAVTSLLLTSVSISNTGQIIVPALTGLRGALSANNAYPHALEERWAHVHGGCVCVYVCVIQMHTHRYVNDYICIICVYTCVYNIHEIVYVLIFTVSSDVQSLLLTRPSLPLLVPFCFLLYALVLPLPEHSLLTGITKHPLSQLREGAEDGREGGGIKVWGSASSLLE